MNNGQASKIGDFRASPFGGFQMVKFPEADARIFKNKFVCRKCKAVKRASARMIAEGLVKCRKCDYKKLKPKRKK